MSVAEAAHRPARTGRSVTLWLAFILVIAAGIGLAWIGAGSMRPEVSSSGLEFRTVKDGQGQPIGEADAALLDYVLTANDGTVFDASQQPTPMAMGSVFPGFAEAMSRMKEGGEYRFTMPEKLAFVGTPPPPGWPKGSPLTFDVRVRKVVRGGAAMMQQQGASGGQPQE
ncbi:MAG: FKBP-type peptidyl-prolyl cis-trans isomerase [Pseudomonadota bacterium]